MIAAFLYRLYLGKRPAGETMMKNSDERSLNDAEVDALLASIDSSGPEKRPEGRVHNGDEPSVANAWELDIHDSSVAELNR